MLNLDELEEGSGVKKKSSKERLKEEKALAALRLKEEVKYNVRKDKFDQELKYNLSCKDLVKGIYDKLGYSFKWPLVESKAKHQRGNFQLILDLKLRRVRLLEDAIKGRDLRCELLRTMHIEIMNQMIKKQEVNINTLTSDFVKARDRLMANRHTFLQTALLKGKQLRDEIRVASYASEKGEEIQKLIQKHEGDLADFNEMCSRHFDEFYRDYEKRIMDKWIIYKNIFEKYKAESVILRRNIYLAKERDNKENEEIDRLKRMRIQFQNQFEVSKNILSPGMERYMTELGQKVDGLEGCVKTLLKIQSKGSLKDEGALDHLNRVSDRVLKRLSDVKTLAERVVRLRRACVQYETEAERVRVSELGQDGLNLASFPSPQVLELQTAKVQAQNAFMTGRIREMKAEEACLKNQLKEVIYLLQTHQDRSQLAAMLYKLE